MTVDSSAGGSSFESDGPPQETLGGAGPESQPVGHPNAPGPLSAPPTVGLGPPDNAAAWDEISDEYQATYRITADSPHYGPLCPDEADLRLCGDVAGKRVLELGCGGGQSSIAFAREGAHVIGVDISAKQLAYARKLSERHEVRVEFKQGDLADLAFIPAGSIDVVFSSYAFQYVERFDRLCRSVERVLSHRGLFVFSHDHPVWDCYDKLTGALKRSYYDTNPEDWFWRDNPESPRMRSWHRPVSDIIETVTRAGLVVETVLEPEPINDPASPWATDYPVELMRRIPATLIVKARKEA